MDLMQCSLHFQSKGFGECYHVFGFGHCINARQIYTAGGIAANGVLVDSGIE